MVHSSDSALGSKSETAPWPWGTVRVQASPKPDQQDERAFQRGTQSGYNHRAKPALTTFAE